MNGKGDKKTFLIGGLLVAIVAMAIGYAALSATLTINGTTTIEASWCFSFVSASAVTTGTAEADAGTISTAPSSCATESILSRNFSATLKTPGDKVTFTYVIKNLGTINAKVEDVIVNGATEEAGGIKITYSGITEGETVEASAEKTITVEVEWLIDEAVENLPSTMSKTFNMQIKFTQA